MSKRYRLILLLILVSSTFLKLYYSKTYVTYTDEILSAIAADSIWDTGLPILPSGGIYTRAPVHHYLLAVPIGLGGIEYLPMRINSIVFSLIKIVTIYLLGTKLLNRQIALTAAFILSISSLFNQFALSGRMYMTYGAFYSITLFCFYEGFIKGRSIAKWLAIFFMSLTMLSSEAGFLIGFVLVFALAIYHKGRWLQDKAIYVAGAIWLLLVWFIWIYDIPGGYQSFTVHSGVPDPRIINAQMSPREIIGNLIYPLRALDKTLPFSMPFFLIMSFMVIKKGELRQHYPLIVLIPAIFIGSFLTYRVQYRIIVAWIPFYILACCQYVHTLLRWTNQKSNEDISIRVDVAPLKNLRLKVISVCIGVYMLLTMSIMYLNKIHGTSELLAYVYQAFGYHDSRVGENLEPSYQYLKALVNPGDTIIVTTVEYGLFFMGPDYNYYYLRQKKSNNSESAEFIPFNKDKEPYYGRPIIDSVEKIKNLMETSGNTIWVVEDYKTDAFVGLEIREFIDEKFKLVFDDSQNNKSKVYMIVPKQVM